ncbi:MAG: NERD domain-containing protein [Candidatus Altiarchaeota archaeon]|nr:NERD domain-containing protein [Candidatus Altiarchaeota archaeon]
MNNFLRGKLRRELSYIFWHLVFGISVYFYLNYLEITKWFILPALIPSLYALKIHFGNFRRLFSGAYGEDFVIEELHKKLPGHRIFHNVWTGKGDIDVLVIGEGGVFVIEIKKLRFLVRAGKNSVKYGKKELLNQVDRNEEHVRSLLSREGYRVPIKSYLLILGKVKGKNSFIVKSPKELIIKIKKRSVLSRDEVREVAAIFAR